MPSPVLGTGPCMLVALGSRDILKRKDLLILKVKARRELRPSAPPHLHLFNIEAANLLFDPL